MKDQSCQPYARPPGVPRERMRWFTGRFVTAGDLTDEQDYFLHRRWMLNRLVHGQGVLCGLTVHVQERPECASTGVVIMPGIALDCYGRELVLDKNLPVHWPHSDAGHEPERVLLAVRYEEDAAAPRYAARDACVAAAGREPTRIREDVSARLLTREEAPACWPRSAEAVHHDCEQVHREGCLEGDAATNGWVPLAVLSRRQDGPIAVHPVGRRPAPAAQLTRIRAINWPHGGVLSMADIARRRGRLEIDFDRPLQGADDSGTGISPGSLRVEFSGAQRVQEPIPYSREPELEGRTKAVFTIEPELWERGEGGASQGHGWRPVLAGQLIYVTLYCEFVLDCHENPVDGDHVGGKLPSGNGTPGGVFRSWFSVTD